MRFCKFQLSFYFSLQENLNSLATIAMAKSQLPFDSVTPKTKLLEDRLNCMNKSVEEEPDTGEKEKAAEENERDRKDNVRCRNDFTTGNITIKCEPEEEECELVISKTEMNSDEENEDDNVDEDDDEDGACKKGGDARENGVENSNNDGNAISAYLNHKEMSLSSLKKKIIDNGNLNNKRSVKLSQFTILAQYKTSPLFSFHT